jgi:hypothetical protein
MMRAKLGRGGVTGSAPFFSLAGLSVVMVWPYMELTVAVNPDESADTRNLGRFR